MCSLAGYFNNSNLGTNRINIMLRDLKHRGPDSTNTWNDESITLGHNRLNIIDLTKNGNQPMISREKDIVIVYYGEIYNYREIKEKLNNYHYFSESDKEVIINAYKFWAEDCVKYFEGMFAFALWDKKKGNYFVQEMLLVLSLFTIHL